MRRTSVALLLGGFALLAYGCRGTNVATAPQVRPSPIPAKTMRAAILARKLRGKRPAPGIKLTGPPVLKRPLDLRAAKKLHVHISGHVTLLVRGRSIDPVVVATPPTTGINHWWTYEEGALPGVGKYMVNVGTGNLIAQSDDVDIPERGIDLAFRRTYNSMSGRDYANTDGSSNPGQFGGGWTNTFDAHIAVNTLGGISVFDIDGARYDYSPSITGCLTPPAGMFNQLCTDGANGYFWYKKAGTVYYFWRPDLAVVLPLQAAYAGRLIAIWGRNYNNQVTFTYSWDGGDATSSAKLNQIVAQNSDGQALTLHFADFSSQRLLQSITRPDGVTIPYTYDSSGNLLTVAEPSNGSPNTTQTYSYNSVPPIHQLSWVASPRWTTGTWGTDGGYVSFGYSSGALHAVGHVGVMNPTPADGRNTPIQSSVPTGSFQYATDTYTTTSGEMSFSDTDGHATNWFYDNSGRVTHTQEATGDASGPTVLDTYAGWDAQNNLISSTDARVYETDYAYDSNGNAIAVALPSVSTGSGTLRPTSLYSYDAHNNVTAYCDPVQTHARGLDWTTRPPPTDTLCSSTAGATRYNWDTVDSSEPYGRLSDSYTPLGYHHHFTYDPSLNVMWWSDPKGVYPTGTFPPLIGQGGVVGMPGVDGIADGLSIIQGVRAYSPSAGVWMSPDADSGNVHDPVSQKSYMWNRNNPVQYADPSGFYGQLEGYPQGPWFAGSPPTVFISPGEMTALILDWLSPHNPPEITESMRLTALKASGTAIDLANNGSKRIGNFFQDLAEMMHTGLKSLGFDLPAIVRGNAVSVHDNQGHSVVIQGSSTELKISQNVEARSFRTKLLGGILPEVRHFSTRDLGTGFTQRLGPAYT